MGPGPTYFASRVCAMYGTRLYLLCQQSVRHVWDQVLLTLLAECASCMGPGSTYFASRVCVMYGTRLYLLCQQSVRHVWEGLAVN
jgi:hypothetical protein